MFKEENAQDLKALGGLPLAMMILATAIAAKQSALFWQLLFGLLLPFAVTILIRMFYFKPRPKKDKYRNFIEKLDASSFPSLHSMRAAAYATILMNFFHNVWLTALLLAAAIGVGAMRVVLKRHDVKDVIAGLVIGAAIGIAIISLGVPDLSRLL